MNLTDKKITAKVETILYPRKDNRRDGSSDFYIIRCDVGTVKGKLSHIPKTDECLTLEGKWQVSTFNGQPEFSFFHATVFMPKDERALLKYACTMTNGCGPAMEGKIWDAMGENWRNVSCSDVKGLTPRILTNLQDTIDFLNIHGEQSSTISWLVSIGTTVKMAECAWEKWKNQTREKVGADPFVLCELPSYGFKDVDEHIRGHFGIGRNDGRRVSSCVKYYVRQLTTENTVIEWSDLYAHVSKAIDADPSEISKCVTSLMKSGWLVGFPEHQRISPSNLYIAEALVWKFVIDSEKNIVEHVKARQPHIRDFDLDATQMEAVQFALDHSFSIINGGAGCGKTTLIRAICYSLGSGVELCAFAGKAAARLKEATQHDAGTIHRMLAYMGDDMGFTRASLVGVTVILDEASMVASDLMAEIVKRSPKRLVLVGDEAQLPPVGSGQPFHDIISLRPSVVKTLTTCYRNREAIFKAALMIRQGVSPSREDKSEKEYWNISGIADARRTHQHILDTVKRNEVDFDKDIILCCRNGETGGETECSVIALNRDIKDIVNPNEDGSYRISAGDRVINTKNDSELDVWNGTTGRCRQLDSAGAMWVDLDFPKSDGETEVLIPKGKLREWQLAYALTVHKSQGSQYRKVFFVCARRDLLTLLSRPMVYTAVTRAKCECHVVGDVYAFQKSIGSVDHKMTVIQELNK